MYPRSGFRSGGTCERTLVPVFRSGRTCERTLVPVFRSGGTSAKTTLLETTLLGSSDMLVPQFPTVTSIGSLPPKNLGKSRGPRQNPAETRRTLGENPAEP